jgi:uncharacterized phage protein gp47/JayE
MSIQDLLDTNACGCCEVAAPPTPEEIRNRAGLTAIRYRVGTFSSFRQAMIEAIAAAELEANGNRVLPLRSWTARTSDDYGIAVLEMWAYLADILAFYQERIANEAFLPTALLRESVLRLAALLGYEPAPGAAATTHLAFILEKDKQVRIPAGLRVQSVPGQDEEPQKFETVEAATAVSRINKVRVHPEPGRTNPFRRGSTGGTLRPSNANGISSALAPGDSLVIFDTQHNEVEEKQVDSLRTGDGHTYLSWSPQILSRNLPRRSQAYKFKRRMRIFGYDAPPSFVRPVQLPPPPLGLGGITWGIRSRSNRDYNIPPPVPPPAEPGPTNTDTFPLDGRYDDLKPGALVLLHVQGSLPRLLTVRSVGQIRAEFPPLSDTVTQVVLDQTLPAFDRRSAVLYELVGPEIRFWRHEYPEPANVSGNNVVVKAEDISDEGVENASAAVRGKNIIFADGTGRTKLVTVQNVESVDYGGASYLRISFTPSLADPLDTLDGETTVLYGNVVKATHGETVAREVLGSGDASASLQSFKIRKAPVTFVSQPGKPHGVANSLQLRINGVLWHEATTLFGREEDEQIYTTSLDDENATTVRLGDGINGSRLPTGRDNVVATYRQGLGRGGNVRAEALTTLLDRPVGLRSVTNPIAAQGGAEPESLDEARMNAPNTVRTFGRVVSLRDFEDAAREFAGVAKARAAMEWDGSERVVRLVVAGDEGGAVTDEIRKNLVEDLNSRRDANRKMVVESYQQIFVQVEAILQVDPGYIDEDVQAAARTALLDYFAFDNLELGQPIHLSNVYQALQQVRGVVAVDVERLQFKDPSVRASHGATDAAVQSHLRIASNELASIQQPATDAVVRLGMNRA